MKGFPRILAVAVLLGLLLSGCTTAGWVIGVVEPAEADLCEGQVELTASLESTRDKGSATLAGAPPEHKKPGYWLVWYRDGEIIGEEEVTGKSDHYTAHLTIDQPGEYYALLWRYRLGGTNPEVRGESNVSVVTECGVVPPPSAKLSTRADVAVVIYGGWDGIPVNAYVGGTAQETMYTARDANGDAAVLWTFYPPARGWNVSVAPQTPPGKDPAEWTYELLRIETRGGGTVENPTSADATIYRGSEKVFYFQLVHKGAE